MKYFHLILYICLVFSCRTKQVTTLDCHTEIEQLSEEIIKYFELNKFDTLAVRANTFPISSYRIYESQVKLLLTQNGIKYGKQIWEGETSFELNKKYLSIYENELVVKYDTLPKRLPNTFNSTGYASFAFKKLDEVHWLVFFSLRRSNLDGETKLILVEQLDCYFYSILASSVVSIS